MTPRRKYTADASGTGNAAEAYAARLAADPAARLAAVGLRALSPAELLAQLLDEDARRA